ncbi:uncharacterized protein LOC115620775 [Scaptodrosophila lebanonensis]|uniref:Uncharacterized protein LOC115620775 n=1 Tax=Drosophila lebanonensis TaxID=7225 RepID=A0A6J2T207_DROLE|nr:uncharacterized protein LOC115620775 [Scaptodrosophila lebanonensis]
MMIGLWLLFFALLGGTFLETTALLNGEKRVIDKCLESYGGLTSDSGQRLQSYTEWSEHYEEIPCFTRCYLNEMFNFENDGFNESKIVALFGKATYEACKPKLEMSNGQRGSCEHAYSGFHCIVSLENDPFILIANMPNITDTAKSAMKECLLEIDQAEWKRISEFSQFPVQEPIPCYTRCFINKLQLFNERNRRWRLEDMRRELAVPLPNANVRGCHRLRARNPCLTVYHQFTCYVMAK